MLVETLPQLTGDSRIHDCSTDGLRLQQAIAEGLPTLPGFVFELNARLDAEPLDMKHVAQLIRTDPSLTAQVLRTYYSLPFAPPAGRFADVAAAVGEARLRALALTCSLIEPVGGHVHAQSVWQHSLLTALVSERLAVGTAYPDPEKAYIAGLLHDVGDLLLIGTPNVDSAPHHTAIGRAIAVAWNYPPDLVEVLELHHRHTEARVDPRLCAIVAFADHYGEHCGLSAFSAAGRHQQLRPWEGGATAAYLLREYLPGLPLAETVGLAKALHQELPSMRRTLDWGLLRLSSLANP